MSSDEPIPAAPEGDGASTDDTSAAGQPADGDEDQTRRKFREALARKKDRAHLGGSSATATQHPHAAPAKRGRTFRRKSG